MTGTHYWIWVGTDLMWSDCSTEVACACGRKTILKFHWLEEVDLEVLLAVGRWCRSCTLISEAVEALHGGDIIGMAEFTTFARWKERFFGCHLERYSWSIDRWSWWQSRRVNKGDLGWQSRRVNRGDWDDNRGESIEEIGVLATVGGRRCSSVAHWRKTMLKGGSEVGEES